MEKKQSKQEILQIRIVHLQEPDQNVSHDSDRTRTLPTTPTLQAIIEESPSILTIEGNVNIVTDEIWNQPGSSHQPHVPRPLSPIQILLQDSELRTPPPPSPVNIRFPDLRGHTPRRRGVRHSKREWTINKCKKLRLEGEQYMGYRRDSRQEKFKVLNDVMRPAPEIGPRCFSKFCTKSKLRGCNNIVETERQGILLVFWKQMDWSQRQQRSSMLFLMLNVEIENK
ncbi:hypothetical protein ACJJTC_005093 [Scirpophaga incertulas]